MQVRAATMQIPWINMLQLKGSTTSVFPSKTVFLSMLRTLHNKQLQRNYVGKRRKKIKQTINSICVSVSGVKIKMSGY